MHAEAANIRRLLLAAPPVWRAAVEKHLMALEASYKASLEARIREADVARLGWWCEQNTAAALRVDIAQLRAEIASARSAMEAVAGMLVVYASPAHSQVGAAAGVAGSPPLSCLQ
jgi:hypothetical protein